jgi:hypothetical protein
MSTEQNSSEKKPVEASSGVTGNLPPPIALYQLATGHYILRKHMHHPSGGSCGYWPAWESSARNRTVNFR